MKKLLSTLLFGLLITTTLSSDLNAEDNYDWYLVPSVSYITTDRSRALEDDEGSKFGLALGKEISDNVNLEFGYGKTRINQFDKFHTKQNSFELDALYFLNKDSTFAPYVVGGIGAIYTKSAGNDETNPIWGGGIGALTKLGSTGLLADASLRTEVRFQQEIDSSDWAHDDVQYRAGLHFPLGAAAPAPVVAAPQDSDKDGVYDDSDKCPGTPYGVKVNSFGCEIVVPKDSDNDGVIDANDKCPNTIAGTKVDARGCPIDPDSDNDGVPNSKDQCPNSAAGVKIDFKGCEIKAVITLPGINFELNSAKLTASSLTILNDAASTLNKYPEINALIAGHTDSSGADAYNMSLSKRRAASVLSYLVSKGISASRLSSEGFGETQPIADNTTKEGRAMNRRVNLRVQD